MGRPLNSSILLEAYESIVKHPGSPYLRLSAVFTAGGLNYTPLKITRLLVNMSTTENYADEIFLHVAIPAGDLMSRLAPFQDDITVELSVVGINENMTKPEPDGTLSRTYRAYFDDHVKIPIESSNDVGQTNIESANLASIEVVVFRLEELFVEQMSYQRTGVGSIRNAVPIDAAVALLTSKAKAIKMDEQSSFKGITVESGHNTLPYPSITIEDGTPVLDLPDMMQNTFGGVYKEGLGFYIQHEHIHIWPLYKIDRKQNASRILRIFVSPDPKSGVVERTWCVPEDSPEILDIWVAGIIHTQDDGLSNMRTHGTSVRSYDPASVMDGFVDVENNLVKATSSNNNIQFKDGDLVNGRNIVNSDRAISNPYVLATRMAKNHGMIVVVTWNHSLPSLILPGMVVELNFDFMGELRVCQGTLLNAHSAIDVDGEGMISQRFQSTTALTLFIDRRDIRFQEWVKEGAPGKSANPQVG